MRILHACHSVMRSGDAQWRAFACYQRVCRVTASCMCVNADAVEVGWRCSNHPEKLRIAHCHRMRACMSLEMRGQALCKHAIVTPASVLPIYHLIIVTLLSWRQLCHGAARQQQALITAPLRQIHRAVAASAWMAAALYLSSQQTPKGMCTAVPSASSRGCTALMYVHDRGQPLSKTNWVGTRAAHGLQEPPCLWPLQSRSCFLPAAESAGLGHKCLPI